MAPTHCEIVNPWMPCRMSSRANAMVQRVMANPESARWAPEGMEATASANVLSLDMGPHSKVGRASNTTISSWQAPPSTLISASSTG